MSNELWINTAWEGTKIKCGKYLQGKSTIKTHVECDNSYDLRIKAYFAELRKLKLIFTNLCAII